MARAARAEKAEQDLTLSELEVRDARNLPVRRFEFADFSARWGEDGLLGNWLVGRIREDFKDLTEQQAVWQLRSAINSNECSLIRTDHGVAFAHLLRRPLEQQPYARVVFLYTTNKQEGYTLVFEIERWCRHQGVTEIEFSRASDVKMEDKAWAFNGLRNRQVTYVRLE